MPDVRSGKSPYVRYGKTPHQYQFKRCSHRRENGKPNARYEQSPNFTGDVCIVCGIILKNFTRPRTYDVD